MKPLSVHVNSPYRRALLRAVNPHSAFEEPCAGPLLNYPRPSPRRRGSSKTMENQVESAVDLPALVILAEDKR